MHHRRLYRLPLTKQKTHESIRPLPFRRLSASKYFHRFRWIKLIFSLLPSVILGAFTIIFTVQQNTSNNNNRQQDREQSIQLTQRAIFDNYIDTVSERLLSPYFNRSNQDHLLTIRAKTLTALRI